MARFQFDDWFGWPCSDIVQFFIDGVDLVPHESLEDVKMRKELENRREGKKVYTSGEWCVHGQIPKIAQKIIKPEMLTFFEETIWDDDEASFRAYCPSAPANEADTTTAASQVAALAGVWVPFLGTINPAPFVS